MPLQLLSAMNPRDAVRAAMRFAVEVDSEKPILFAAELLIAALADEGVYGGEWEEILGAADVRDRAPRLTADLA